MKKNGFTLAELLITMGIVGVVSALVAPAVTNITPDKNKVFFIRDYNQLATVTSHLVNNPEMYYQMIHDDNTPKCLGLGCTGEPIPSGYSDCTGTKKYFKLVAKMMEIPDSQINNSSMTFTTGEGVVWKFSSKLNSSEPFQLNTTVNITYKNSGKDCLYSNSCKRPRQFQLKVDTFGGILADDAMSKAYLKNQLNMNDRKFDLKEAAKIYSGK